VLEVEDGGSEGKKRELFLRLLKLMNLKMNFEV